MSATYETSADCLGEIAYFDINVPENYQREAYTDSFHKKYDSEFYSISTFLMEKSRNHPPVIISPGMHLRVSIIKIKEWISIGECLRFLKNHRALLFGAHGIMLAYDLAKEKIPLDMSLHSFDQEHLSYHEESRAYVLPTIGCLYKQWLMLEENAYNGIFAGNAFFCFQAVSGFSELPDRSGDTAFLRQGF